MVYTLEFARSNRHCVGSEEGEKWQQESLAYVLSSLRWSVWEPTLATKSCPDIKGLKKKKRCAVSTPKSSLVNCNAVLPTVGRWSALIQAKTNASPDSSIKTTVSRVPLWPKIIRQTATRKARRYQRPRFYCSPKVEMKTSARFSQCLTSNC